MNNRLKYPQSHTKTCRGFTLIELLVVVSIIALLISILLPSLQKARAQAKRLLCQTNLKNIGIAVYQYNIQEGDYPALTWDSSGNAGGTYYWTERLIKAGLIDGYQPPRTRNTYKLRTESYESYTCPTYRSLAKYEPDVYWTSISYAYNDRYLSPSLGSTVNSKNPAYLGSEPRGLVITVIESDHIYMGADYAFPNSIIGDRNSNGIQDGTENFSTFPQKRHGGLINSAWTDGHVEAMQYEQYHPRMINPKTTQPGSY